MDLSAWLLSVLDLFADVLAVSLDVPILAFFVTILLFLSVTSLLAYLVRMGRKGKF